jgi:lipid-binding SYLF domain-containing protein
LLVVLSLCLSPNASAQDQEGRPDKRLRHAATAFQEIMATPDKGIPQELLEKAECIIIVPDLLKGAFAVGGKYGRGYASCRHGVHGWSSPAAVAIEGGSFGFPLAFPDHVQNRVSLNRPPGSIE